MKSIYGIPALEDSQPIGDVAAWSRSLADAIARRDAAVLDTAGKIAQGNPDTLAAVAARTSVLEGRLSDTGWVTVPPASGVTAVEPIQYRIRHGEVLWRGKVKRSAGSFAAGATQVATVPAPALPPKVNGANSEQVKTCASDGGTSFVNIPAGGNALQVFVQNGTSWALDLSALRYLTD